MLYSNTHGESTISSTFLPDRGQTLGQPDNHSANFLFKIFKLIEEKAELHKSKCIEDLLPIEICHTSDYSKPEVA